MGKVFIKRTLRRDKVHVWMCMNGKDKRSQSSKAMGDAKIGEEGYTGRVDWMEKSDS